MKAEIVAAKKRLQAAINAPLTFISIETDNASPEENEQIASLIESLNTQHELSYYLSIYEAAKKFVEVFV